MNVPYERESAATHTANLIAWMIGLAQNTAGRLTDFNVGSITRTLLETYAIRLEHLDAKVFGALRRAIPTVLYEFFGEGDGGVTSSVGFPLIPSVAAVGIVRFQRRPGVAGPLAVPVDATLTVSPEGSTLAEKLYRVIVPATMADTASFIDTLAECTVPGTFGNTPANTMELKTVSGDPTAMAGFLGATNPAAFLSGLDAETSESRRQRFAQYIRNLARCQDDGLAVAARLAKVVVNGQVTERVLFARARSVAEKVGRTNVYIDNGGGGASAALVAAAQQIIDGSFAPDGTPIVGYKAAGIIAEVKAVTPQVVGVTCAIRLDPGASFAAVQLAVRAAVEEYLFGLGVFQDLILADLSSRIVNVAGVTDVTITTPTANVVATEGARILPGAVLIAEMTLAA